MSGFLRSLADRRLNKSNPTGILSTTELRLLSIIGTATPGTNKGVRSADIFATSALSRKGRFANIPSSGGFTILGKNALGQDIARDNTTGTVRPVSAFGPISATARAIGKQPKPAALARKGDTRRTTDNKSTSKKPKPTLGSDTILGTQSILG